MPRGMLWQCISASVAPSPDTLRQAYVLLDEVRGYLAGRPKSVAKMEVYWQMGRIAWRLGYDRHGPRLILKAREGFRQLGEPFEFAMASLHATGIALECGELDEYDALVRDTYAELERFQDPTLLEAFAAWSLEARLSRAQLEASHKALKALRDGGW